MSELHDLTATAPRGLEDLLAAELTEIGAAEARAAHGAVHFRGDLELAYRACLWSRLANAILLPIAQFEAPDEETLYNRVRGIRWDNHVDVDGSLAVTFHSVRSKLHHTQYAGLRVKDAIVDQFRGAVGSRPDVDTDTPDLHVNVFVIDDQATVSVDLSGSSLHRRGYREGAVAAPLKENVAAAILIRAGWPEIAAAGGPLVDPLCGSGTFLIEGGLMAGDVAPGLFRDYWGFTNWVQHEPRIWGELVQEAGERREAGREKIPIIFGSDRDAKAVEAAKRNVRGAGLSQHVTVIQRDLAHVARPNEADPDVPGLVVANPPYGERLGEREEAEALHELLGQKLKADFPGWKATVLTGDKELGFALKMRANKINQVRNGPLECVMLNFDIRARRG